MQALVTGAGGFVGGHLLGYLSQTTPDLALHGTLLNEDERKAVRRSVGDRQPQYWIVDLRDPGAVRDLIAHIRPDRIFHLAGQASPPRSFQIPWETLESNIRGTLNLLEAVRTLQLPTRILVVSSAEIYGPVPAAELPVTEETRFVPTSPYSVSKIAQDMLAWQYSRAHRVFTVRARPFNHIGPGQSQNFAVPDWAAQIVEAEAGRRAPVVEVGNLSAARDFTDVRDVVRAYVLLLEQGEPGEVYNICSGKTYTMQFIFDTLVRLSATQIEARVAPERLRPIEIPVMYGTYWRLQQRTGWQPQIPIEQTLQDVLEECRLRLHSDSNNPSQP